MIHIIVLTKTDVITIGVGVQVVIIDAVKVDLKEKVAEETIMIVINIINNECSRVVNQDHPLLV